MTDVGEDGEELSEVEQAFSANWNYSWGDTKFNSTEIGTAVNRACFMSGVAGYLTTNKFPEGDSQAGAGVTIDPATNQWKIYVDPAFTGVTLQTWARCVNSTSLTPEVTWRSGQGAQVLAAATRGRRCFLTSITTGRGLGYDRGGFRSPYDMVYITSENGNWVINGSQSGLVWAKARCINVSQDLGQFYAHAISGSSSVVPLVPNEDGATCFLTQVHGAINNGSDWEHGPFVSLNTSYNYFDFNVKNGTGGRVRCVR